MKKLLTALAAITLFASCQKEISFDPNNPAGTSSGGTGTGGSTGSGLLVKAVAVAGAETQTTLYSYDAQSRLETITTSGTSGGFPADSYQKFFRDGAGRIVKVLQKLADPPGATSDTTVKTFHYPTTNSLDYDYSLSVQTLNLGGFSLSTTDSSAYTYSGGKMASYSSALFSSIAPGASTLNSRYDFTYDASNRVTGMKVYTDASNPGGTMDLDADNVYAYAATAVNTVYMSTNGAQNLALNGLPSTGAGIIAKMVTTSSSTVPPTNLTITFTYVTGTGNKPTSGTALVTQTGQPTQTTKYTFYYQ